MAKTPARAKATGRGTVDRESLVRVSADLFRARGYAVTTTREIAEHMGIQKGSLYHHVSTKEDLLYWVCMQSLGHLTTKVTEALSHAAEGSELRELIKAHVVAELDEQNMHAVMLSELQSLNDERREKVEEMRDSYDRLVYETIVRAQAHGEVRADVQARVLSLALLDMLNWAVFWYRKSGQTTPEELGVVLADIFLNGASSSSAIATPFAKAQDAE
jgi:AcrR family transcriptional regulator